MQKEVIQKKILRKLMSMKPHKWGKSHTEENNLVKGLPSHLRGCKVVDKAIKELYNLQFLTRLKKTGEWHVSLNPRKKEEIYRFLGISPRS
ncbi:MAG: hypothetical protein KJ939_01415 [Nanoarchaeota archaeon]|nr:hypothetical protein [Nanoarchaeota archaeon]MBU4351720.1 hypothetical protein [Nanoarchaeota archaeon]